MRFIISALSLLSFLISWQSQAASQTWQGELNGQAIQAQLELGKQQLRGTVTLQGYSYRLQAQAQGQYFVGQLFDQNNTPVAAKVSPHQGKLLFNVFANGSQNPPLSFFLQSSSASNNGPAAAVAGQRDPALFGRWVYSESYSDPVGDFSGAYQERVTFFPDGRIALGDTSVGAGNGGAHVYGGGEAQQLSYWKVQVQTNGNRHLFIQENGQWHLYGRYYIENGRMLVTKADGSKEFWRR